MAREILELYMRHLEDVFHNDIPADKKPMARVLMIELEKRLESLCSGTAASLQSEDCSHGETVH